MAPKTPLESDLHDVNPGHVLDWKCLEDSDVPWRDEALSRLQESGLQTLCTAGTGAPLLLEDIATFFSHAKLVEDPDQIISRVQGMDIIITAEVIRSVFSLPMVNNTNPVLFTTAAMLHDLKYEVPKTKRTDIQRNGFSGINRFYAITIGYCLMCKRTSFDSVSGEQLKYMYYLAKGIPVDWSRIVYTLMRTKLANRGFGRILTTILQALYPSIFASRPTIAYPSRLILKRFLDHGGAEARAVERKQLMKVLHELEVQSSFKKPSSKPSGPVRSHRSSKSYKEMLSETVRIVKESLQTDIQTQLAQLQGGPSIPPSTQLSPCPAVPSPSPSPSPPQAPVLPTQPHSQPYQQQPTTSPEMKKPTPKLFSSLTYADLIDFWILYAKSHVTPQLDRDMWLKCGQTLLSKGEVLDWAVDNGYLSVDMDGSALQQALTLLTLSVDDQPTEQQGDLPTASSFGATIDAKSLASPNATADPPCSIHDIADDDSFADEGPAGTRPEATTFSPSHFSKLLDEKYSQHDAMLVTVREEVTAVKDTLTQQVHHVDQVVSDGMQTVVALNANVTVLTQQSTTLEASLQQLRADVKDGQHASSTKIDSLCDQMQKMQHPLQLVLDNSLPNSVGGSVSTLSVPVPEIEKEPAAVAVAVETVNESPSVPEVPSTDDPMNVDDVEPGIMEIVADLQSRIAYARKRIKVKDTSNFIFPGKDTQPVENRTDKEMAAPNVAMTQPLQIQRPDEEPTTYQPPPSSVIVQEAREELEVFQERVDNVVMDVAVDEDLNEEDQLSIRDLLHRHQTRVYHSKRIFRSFSECSTINCPYCS